MCICRDGQRHRRRRDGRSGQSAGAGAARGCGGTVQSGYDSSEYTETAQLEAGHFYDYTFYMLPTVYTVAPGHHLTLVLTTWDPYRAFLDESFAELDTDKDSEEIDYDYSYVIDNEAIQVKMPVAEE